MIPRRFRTSPLLLTAAGALLWSAACDSKPDGGPAAQVPTTSAASVPAQSAGASGAAPAGQVSADGHVHNVSAPHDATLVAVGNEAAHLEVKKEGKKLTIFVLDGEGEYPVRIAAKSIDVTVKSGSDTIPVTLAAVASTLTGEEVGNTSQFEGASDRLEGLEKFDATVISLEIKGEKFGPITFPYPEGSD